MKTLVYQGRLSLAMLAATLSCKITTTSRAFSSVGRVESTAVRSLFSTKSIEANQSLTSPLDENVEGGSGSNSRIPRGNFSLDVKTIVSETNMILSHLKSRCASTEVLDAATEIASLQSQRVESIMKRDAFLNQRKEASAMVGQLMRNFNGSKKKTGDSDDKDDEEVSESDALAEVERQKKLSNEAAEQAGKADEKLDLIQNTMDGLLSGIPNLLDDRVPDGNDESENELVLEWGDIDALPKKLGWYHENIDNDEIRYPSFQPKWHDDVAIGLKGYQSEAAVKMSGTRFVALSGPVARLERALAMFFLDMHTTQHGYTEVSVPYLVGRTALEGTSQLPKFQEDLFAIANESHTCNGEDAFLIPTAEVPLTNLHSDSILEEKDLPISYVAWTPCFRAEAGSSGRDTKGLIRTHQFQKVELVKITTAETSDEQHELLTTHAEACLKALELPYRKVRLCSGDIGFSARHCYDLEVWLPGAAEYREISSCSNTGDFQARRMALRYRPELPSSTDDEADGNKKKKKKPKPELCHTINGSGLAIGRALVAVLENYQRPDGSVVVPEALRPYMGGVQMLEKQP